MLSRDVVSMSLCLATYWDLFMEDTAALFLPFTTMSVFDSLR